MSLKKIDSQLSASALINRLLTEPELARAVGSLPPRTLGKVIDKVGLEDAGELIMLATTSQLREVLDDDLWKSAAEGDAEQFDEKRFALWLEIMLQAGEDALVKRLVELPEELVIMAFSSMVLVLDLDEMAARAHEEIDLDDKALESAQTFEFDQYTIISKGIADFDLIVTVLDAVYTRESYLFERICEACCAASTAFVEESGGLHSVLSVYEMYTEDAAAERADRRASKGYVAPTDAKAFLSLSSRETPDQILFSDTEDPITRAYFREYAPEETVAASRREDAPEIGRPSGDASLSKVLRAAGVETSPATPPLLEGRTPEKAATIRDAVAQLGGDEAETFESMSAALAYLSNLVISGFSHADYTVRPIDAAQAVLDLCDVGFEAAMRMASLDTEDSPSEILRRFGPVRLFRLGWSRAVGESGVKRFSELEAAIRRCSATDKSGTKL